jgi:hypothetical protein
MKKWRVVYKVNPEMDTCRYDAYMERHDDDNVVHVYQEENEAHQNFTIFNWAGLTKLATHVVQLMKEELGPSKKRIQKSKYVAKRQERREQLNVRVTKADSDVDDF